MFEQNYTLETSNYTIHIGDLADGELDKMIKVNYAFANKIVLMDENVHELWGEYFQTTFSSLSKAEFITIPAGEENKSLEICSQVWQSLTEYQITRNDVLICVGGGVVTDMGGFIASLYKRGIDFIHVPTSLLGMVDASIGGKTAVDLANYKNIIGVFSNQKAVFIDPKFLDTLPLIDRIGGWMEMAKHGLISSKTHWEELKNVHFKDFHLSGKLIVDSLTIKNNIVKIDPFEKDIRRSLNFGHTFGHAVESYCLEGGETINHGIAVGMGIIIESFWSWKKELIEIEDLDEICLTLSEKVGLPALPGVSAEDLWHYMLNDKKNEKGEVRATLLKRIGTAVIDQVITFDLVEEGLKFYQEQLEL